MKTTVRIIQNVLIYTLYSAKQRNHVAVKNRILAIKIDLREKEINKIMSLVDTEGCTEKEIVHVLALIKDHLSVFGLSGEPLPAANLLQHVIKLKTEKNCTHKTLPFTSESEKAPYQ